MAFTLAQIRASSDAPVGRSPEKYGRLIMRSRMSAVDHEALAVVLLLRLISPGKFSGEIQGRFPSCE